MKRPDLTLALAVVAVSATAGILIALQGSAFFFYQNFTPELVYFACGHGLQHPGSVSPKLLAFLLRENLTFDCADLEPVTKLGPPGLFVVIQIYFSWIVALIWRISSVSYLALWPLVGFVVGFYSAGCFVLLRMFFKRIPAAAGALFLTFSPVGLPIVISLRDYGKAPFFIWAVAFLILALRASSLRKIVLYAAASGLMVGIGCGFRADLIILLPIGTTTLLIAFERRLLAMRALAACVYMAIAFASAFPILSAGNSGTHGSVIIQGMSDPFRAYLGLESSLYSFGDKYSDELVLSSIAADEAPKFADWQAGEGRPVYGVSQATTLSGQNWERFFPLFVADFVTQAFKSAGWIVGFPALAAGDRPPDPGYSVMMGPPISVVLKPVYSLLAHPWMPWLGLAGMVVFFWRIWSKSKSEAIGLAFLFGTLLTYPVVQFSVRHVFHLEFIWLLAMLSILQFPFAAGVLRSSAVSFFVTLIGAAAFALTVYLLLVNHQEAQLRVHLEALLANDRQLIARARGVDVGEHVHIPLPVPAVHEAILRSPPDSMTPRIAGIGIQWEVASAADRLLFTFLGNGCSDKIKVSANYSKTDDVWQPMDHTYGLLANQPANGARLLVPAFYRPTQHLSSFDVTGISSGCEVKLERITGETVFPALFSVVLPANWKELQLHLGFGRF